MAFAEDLTVFFDTDEFAVPATPSGGGAAITVIFDREFIAALGGDISGTEPKALAPSADVASFVPGTTTLTIAGADHRPAVAAAVTYNVRDVHPDGTGVSLLVLEAT
jgi:hypothetical protein